MKIRDYLPLLIVFIVALSLRLIWLDRIPTGLSDDELGFILNAKSVFLTGKDLSGIWSPFSLTPITGQFPQAELPYLIMSPFIGLLPLSLFTAKFPYAVISAFLVILLYLITSKLIGTKEAFFVGLVGAFNPWSIFFGRTAYEAPLAIFFYLLAFYILITAKGWKILLAFIPLFIGFYSYMGTKLIFLPYTILITLYSWRILHQKKYLKQYLILLILSSLLFVYFLLSIQHQSTKQRLSELSTPYNPMYKVIVDNERKLSVDTPYRNLLSNKFLAFGKDSVEKYLRVFSTNLLFINGESRATFSLWYHGYFYYLDLLFIITSSYILFVKRKSLWLFLSALIFIAPAATVASNVETGFAALRASLLYPLFIIMIGYGIWHIVSLRKQKIYLIAVLLIFLSLYGIQVLNFMNLYFLRNPIYNSEGFGFSRRVLSKYIDLASEKNNKVLVISDAQGLSTPTFKHYIFYSNGYNKDNSEEIARLIRNNATEYKKLKISNCPDRIPAPNTIVVAPFDSNCSILRQLPRDSAIAKLSDGGPIYYIFNDQVCNQYGLNPYPAGITFEDLRVERQSEKDFCGNFITRPK